MNDSEGMSSNTALESDNADFETGSDDELESTTEVSQLELDILQITASHSKEL